MYPTLQAVRTTVNAYGRLDIAVSTPGINIRKRMAAYTEEEFDRIVGLNLKGTFFFLQETSAVMAEQGGGSIIACSSMRALMVEPGSACTPPRRRPSCRWRAASPPRSARRGSGSTPSRPGSSTRRSPGRCGTTSRPGTPTARTPSSAGGAALTRSPPRWPSSPVTRPRTSPGPTSSSTRAGPSSTTASTRDADRRDIRLPWSRGR
ncbi:SDR family oxidoreductase [Nonomuraea sp. NEAU-A123]|nr:SDR family oxidoreductase [Nonomuraea sp. NEAU-A123]